MKNFNNSSKQAAHMMSQGYDMRGAAGMNMQQYIGGGLGPN